MPLPEGPEKNLLEPHLEDAKTLDGHYIPTRYPDALPDLTPSEAYSQADAADAIRRAGGIIEVVDRLFEEWRR